MQTITVTGKDGIEKQMTKKEFGHLLQEQESNAIECIRRHDRMDFYEQMDSNELKRVATARETLGLCAKGLVIMRMMGHRRVK